MRSKLNVNVEFKFFSMMQVAKMKLYEISLMYKGETLDVNQLMQNPNAMLMQVRSRMIMQIQINKGMFTSVSQKYGLRNRMLRALGLFHKWITTFKVKETHL
jgi:hypothetical protein